MEQRDFQPDVAQALPSFSSMIICNRAERNHLYKPIGDVLSKMNVQFYRGNNPRVLSDDILRSSAYKDLRLSPKPALFVVEPTRVVRNRTVFDAIDMMRYLFREIVPSLVVNARISHSKTLDYTNREVTNRGGYVELMRTAMAKQYHVIQAKKKDGITIVEEAVRHHASLLSPTPGLPSKRA